MSTYRSNRIGSVGVWLAALPWIGFVLPIILRPG